MFRNAKRMGRWIAVALAIGLFSSSLAMAKKPPTLPPDDDTPPYTFVDLLGLPAADFLQSDAHAVSEPDANGALFVAGNSRDAGKFYPVAWSVEADGSFSEPLDLGGPAIKMPADANNAGIVVTSSGHVFVPPYLDAQELPMGDAANAVRVYASAINNHDQIVGWIIYDGEPTGYGKGALWQLVDGNVPDDPVILEDFYPPGATSFIPKAISETGVMAGNLEDIAIAAVARFQGSELQIDPLGTVPGFTWSGADAISSDGEWVTGTSRNLEGPSQAFLFSTSTAGLVGLVGLAGAERNSFAWDVNTAGHVVGTSDTGEGRYSMTAVLWRDGQVFDLNTLTDAGNKAHLAIPKAINDAGHIVGLVDYSRPISEAHGYLLIPNGE